MFYCLFILNKRKLDNIDNKKGEKQHVVICLQLGGTSEPRPLL